MVAVNVAYGDIRSQQFQDFVKKAEVDYRQQLSKKNLASRNTSEDTRLIGKLNKVYSGSFDYFLLLEKTHKVLHGTLKRIQQMSDVSLINALSSYNIRRCGGSNLKIYEERMKIDVFTLLILQGQSYYQLAFNECERIDEVPFHAKAFEHLGKGIVHGIKSKSFVQGVNYGYYEKCKERFGLRAIGLKDIQLMLMLYLFSCYKTTGSIRIVNNVLLWLDKIGYQWMVVPDAPANDLMNEFLLYKLPAVIPATEGKRFMEVFIGMNRYKKYIATMYPDIPEILKKRIDNVDDLSDKYSGYLAVY